MDPVIFVERLGYLFYIVSPNKTSFETTEEVPDYYMQVIPNFFLLIILEQCILLYKKKPILRINDTFGSVSQGMFLELSRVAVRSIELISYTHIYNNWRLATLPWNSPWTWWLCFLGVDLAYYWLHRATHEVNILWAAHQVHHSSEEYNLSTALRQSVIQHYFIWFLNLPMALGIPPSVFLVHQQFNLLYQFWIHTQLLPPLGPLEYILNTASHHRVHHGRNRYCIDKNYGGTLIIWDRLFGTFQAEKEEVVYGLTHPINSFETIYIQFCHYIHIWRTFWSTKGFGNKLSVILKGPGWQPGTPWHGNLEDIPEVKAPVKKFDPPLPLWCQLYAWVNLIPLISGLVFISESKKLLPDVILWGFVAYEVFSMSSIGMLLEGRFYAPWVELSRWSLYLAVDYFLLPYTHFYKVTGNLWILVLRSAFLMSFIFWLQYCLRSVTVKMHTSKLKKDE